MTTNLEAIERGNPYAVSEAGAVPNLKKTVCRECYDLLQRNELKETNFENNNNLIKSESRHEGNLQDDIFVDGISYSKKILEDQKLCCICRQIINNSSVIVEDVLLKSMLENGPVKPDQESEAQSFTDLCEMIHTTLESSNHNSSTRHYDTIVKLEPDTEEFNEILGINAHSEFIFESISQEECNDCESLSTKSEKPLENPHEIVITSQNNSTGIPMYKCGECSYTSDRRHFLTHINGNEHKGKLFFKCGTCSHRTKNVYSMFYRHLSTHTTPTNPFRCPHCPYEATQKPYLTRHISINHSPENPTFECSHCPFSTRHRTALLNHLLIHKDTQEVPTYKCDNCTYQTRHKRYLNRHRLTHKSKLEVPTYSCDVCSYRAKRKDVMRGHMLNHINGANLKKYKCRSCNFETKYKYDLKTHKQAHKQEMEVQ